MYYYTQWGDMLKKAKSTKIIMSVIAVLLVLIVVFECFVAPRSYSANSVLMGTSVTAQIKSKKDYSKDMISSVSAVDKLISRTKEESEISLLNKKRTLTVSDETLKLIKKSIEVSEKTEGAFDITAGKLTSLWNFDGGNKTVPKKKDIADALMTVGYKNIEIDGNTVTLKNGAEIDMGAVGKGAGCDDAIGAVCNEEISSAIISVGGSVGVYGKEEKIGVRDPFKSANDSFATVKIGNAFVSTSGNYEKYFEVNKKRYCHILDLTTGYSAETNLVSVTVICDSGFVSDALSTAMYVMGFGTEAQQVLDYYNAMAIFVYNDKTVKVYNQKYQFDITGEGYEKVETTEKD